MSYWGPRSHTISCSDCNFVVHCFLFSKVTLSYTEDIRIPEQRPDDIDMQILRNVKRTASRSNHLLDELKTLKSKVYGLENDLRHL